jgi:hypothetical protein
MPGVADSSIEFGTDTTRAITRMVFSGTSRRFPDIRVIWSHAGGTMPYLIERFTRMAESKQYAKLLPEGFLPEARRFFYDTAQVANHTTLTCAREVVPDSHFSPIARPASMSSRLNPAAYSTVRSSTPSLVAMRRSY